MGRFMVAFYSELSCRGASRIRVTQPTSQDPSTPQERERDGSAGHKTSTHRRKSIFAIFACFASNTTPTPTPGPRALHFGCQS